MEERNEQPIETPAPDELVLQRYIDGRLSESEQADVQKQLRTSADARRCLDALREEDKLIRNAVETLSEPPVNISEKVLATLYAEQRQRTALDAARRFRRRFVAAVAAAAMVMLTVWTLRPRDPAGAMVSGTGLSVVKTDGSAEALQATAPFYDGDTLKTGRGEFVRLRLTDGSEVDLYEDSKLTIDQTRNRSPMLTLHAGRAHFHIGEQSLGVLIQTFAGHISADANAGFDLWLVGPGREHWPYWAGPYNAAESRAAPDADPRQRRVSLYVTEGYASIYAPQMARGLQAEVNQRVLFGPGQAPTKGRIFDVRQALDFHRAGLVERDAKPEGRALLGLLDGPDWQDIGDRLGLTSNLTGGVELETAVKDAFNQLAEAQATVMPRDRALRFAEGQQALRDALQSLPLSDKRRWFTRTLEGLAHYERGRALLALTDADTQARAEAQGAFLASAVALDEALNGGGRGTELAADKAPGLDTRPDPAIAVTTQLSHLAPDDQCLLWARFYRPWALHYRLLLSGDALPAGDEDGAAEDPAELFAKTHEMLDDSIDGVAAQLGRAVALARQGTADLSQATLHEIISTSIAGLSDESRAHLEGLRQAAHVELIRQYAFSGDGLELDDTVDCFGLRWPLHTQGPAAQAIRSILNQAMQQRAEKALRTKDHPTALHCYHELLSQPQAMEHLSLRERWQVRVGMLEAQLGMHMARHAVRTVKQLEAMDAPALNEIEKARYETLKAKAHATLDEQKKAARSPTPAPESAPAQNDKQPQSIMLEMD